MPRGEGIRLLCALSAAAAFLAALPAAWPASPAPYPNRPVRFIVPFPAGGGGDTVARLLARRLQEALGPQWVVDNRSGAAGNIGAEIVARAEPDGYTVLLGFNSVLTINPLLYKLSFDMAKDLAPVVMMTSGQHMLALHPSVKAGSLNDFIALAKAKPGLLNYASSGMGSPPNLAAELFKVRAGINMTHVPYKGGGLAAAAVLAGEVQLIFGSLPSTFPYVAAGRLKALAVTGLKRAAPAPDIPTIDESGFPGFEVVTWHGLLVPARTPERIVRTLQDETVKALQSPELMEQIVRQGLEVRIKLSQQFAEHIRLETAQWAGLIKTAGIKME